MSNTRQKAPVLFVVFNRPGPTKQVFEQIRTYKPEKLYIASDGARADRPGEQTVVEQTRKMILDGIDWDCQIRTLFRDENAGCGKAVSEAISWVFEQEEYTVILEDDCVPAQEFFTFCEILLPEYKNEEKVMQINGFNPQASQNSSHRFSFSRYPKIWGWGTWKRAWDRFDFSMEHWPEYKKQKKHYRLFPLLEAMIHEYIWDHYYRELQRSPHPRAWGIQWSVSIFMNEGLCVVPEVNMIRNIGMGVNATNCVSNIDPYEELKYGKLLFPLHFPDKVILNLSTNKIDSGGYMRDRVYSLTSKIKKLVKLTK